MEQLVDNIRGILGIIILFSFAIFIHELGHFMFAKLFGVFVETFSIGFGKKLWKRKWGDTEYALSAIPFGGYVKLRGMHSKELEEIIHGTPEEAEAASATVGQGPLPENGTTLTEAAHQQASGKTMTGSIMEEMNVLRAKPFWQKFLILSAGCINNFMTAVVVYFLMAWVGYYEAEPLKPIIERVDESVAAMVPIQPGDRVLEVADERVET